MSNNKLYKAEVVKGEIMLKNAVESVIRNFKSENIHFTTEEKNDIIRYCQNYYDVICKESIQ